MTDADAVRRVALALPRSYEVQVRGRWKFRVKQIVFCAFSRDESRWASATRWPSATG